MRFARFVLCGRTSQSAERRLILSGVLCCVRLCVCVDVCQCLRESV